jgi:cysteinyl-tRNA synthetase
MPLPIQLYNSESRESKDFHPMQADQVKLYVCGPTVYNDAHLGHARCYITWDVLYRTLTAFGYDVTYARNITDVDDKILKRASDLGVTPEQVATENMARFREDMLRLNTLPPTIEPQATQHIDGMLAMIQTLVDKDHAYTTSDGVYFSTQAMPNYGRLSRRDLDEQRVGDRVDDENEKKHPADFALWKFADESEYGWMSPWGYGRPGWHIECSAMIKNVLGDQIDIHAGGADLLFPHHENEIAQSECCSGQSPFVKLWMHNGFVNTDGEKMSKSLGNFATVRELLAPENKLDANGLRYFLLSHHYRMPVDFTPDALKASQTRVNKLMQQLGLVFAAADITESWIDEQSSIPVQRDNLLRKEQGGFADALSEDMNTPRALGGMTRLLKPLKNNVAHGQPVSKELIQDLVIQLLILGFDLAPAKALMHQKETPAETHHVILKEANPKREAKLIAQLNERQAAKKAKDFAKSDEIRDALQAQRFTITDRAGGWVTLEEH